MDFRADYAVCWIDFQVHGKKILKLLQKIFSWIPLATVINHKVLVVHGGISDSTDLDMVARIDRHRVREASSLSQIRVFCTIQTQES